MEFGQLMEYILVYVSCKFEMYIFAIGQVIGKNVPIAFLYVLSIVMNDSFPYRISLQRFRRRKRSYGLGERGQAPRETVLSVSCSSIEIYLLFWSCF